MSFGFSLIHPQKVETLLLMMLKYIYIYMTSHLSLFSWKFLFKKNKIKISSVFNIWCLWLIQDKEYMDLVDMGNVTATCVATWLQKFKITVRLTHSPKEKVWVAFDRVSNMGIGCSLVCTQVEPLSDFLLGPTWESTVSADALPHQGLWSTDYRV